MGALRSSRYYATAVTAEANRVAGIYRLTLANSQARQVTIYRAGAIAVVNTNHGSEVTLSSGLDYLSGFNRKDRRVVWGAEVHASVPTLTTERRLVVELTVLVNNKLALNRVKYARAYIAAYTDRSARTCA